jgi:membrane protease YdiL (CAAX protease family)
MVWHLPAFFYHETYTNMEWFLVPGMLVGGVLLTWLYNSTEGSIIMVAIWHTLFDLLSASRASGEWVAPVMTAGVIFLAIRILRVHGPERLSNKEKQTL